MPADVPSSRGSRDNSHDGMPIDLSKGPALELGSLFRHGSVGKLPCEPVSAGSSGFVRDLQAMVMDDPESTLPIQTAPVAYICPGEVHPIPRSIHLARLAAYYPKCRECKHRHDTGQLPRSTVGRLEQTAARIVRPSPFGPEGVRGEYLNHLTRQIAGRIAEAVADYCWQSHPLVGRVHALDDDGDDQSCPAAQSRPVIVIGHDARPSSPDLCVGVSIALRRMGCEVVDIGRATGPSHAFSVEHLQADAGLYVTGSGSEPQSTGLDLVGPRGVPWSLAGAKTTAPATLNDIERRYLSGVSRPTRLGGAQRYFDALVPYRASLLKHFRDLRPLRVVCVTSDILVMQSLQSIFDPLPCDLISLPDAGGSGSSDARSGSEPLSRALRRAIKESDSACGIVVDEDGRGLSIYDELGRRVPAESVFVRLINGHRGSRHLQVCLLESSTELLSAVRGSFSTTTAIAGGREALAMRLFDPAAGFGIETAGRLWIKDSVPTCDATITIGMLLQLLSQHREPLSRIVATE